MLSTRTDKKQLSVKIGSWILIFGPSGNLITGNLTRKAVLVAVLCRLPLEFDGEMLDLKLLK